MNKQPPTFTVGITTCYGDDSILATVKSIRNSEWVKPFPLIIVADRQPVKAAVKKALAGYGVRLIENKTSGSQFKKKKQILRLCRTDLIIFTNDDVLFDRRTLATVVAEFERHRQLTLISVFNRPLPSNLIVGRAVNVGTNIVNQLALNWNRGDNYLSVIGRFEALRTAWIKKYFALEDDVVSSDQYLYFANKKFGGRYRYLPGVAIAFKNPQNLGEYLRKSSRFQHAREEMARYFGIDRLNYQIPPLLFFKSALAEFYKTPFLFIVYLIISLYARLFSLPKREALNPIWQPDLSTKNL